MSFLGMLLTVLGLSVFETVSSVDNAIINADKEKKGWITATW